MAYTQHIGDMYFMVIVRHRAPHSCLNWYDENLAASCDFLFRFSGMLIELRRRMMLLL
jgi:hypothetical protein